MEMIPESTLRYVGEYALLALLFLLIYSLINKGIFSRRIVLLLSMFIVFYILGSEYCQTIRTYYIFFFALLAALGKFMGAFEIMMQTARGLENSFFILKISLLVVLASLVVIMDFAEVLFAPLSQSALPSTWWRAGSWMLPALGIATALNDSARTAIRNMFPGANTRMLLFLFVFAAGLLVPIYLPAMDSYLRIAAILGAAVGLIFGSLTIRRTGAGI
jgi:hypothetical protein